MLSLAGIARDLQNTGANIAIASAKLNPLPAVRSGVRTFGNDIAGGATRAWNAIPGTPAQKGIIIGSLAALAVGAVFTGGADLAVAPEVVGAEEGAGLAGFAVIPAGDVGATAAEAESTTLAGSLASGLPAEEAATEGAASRAAVTETNIGATDAQVAKSGSTWQAL